MSTKFLSPGWRMPRNANQSKSSNYSMVFNGTSGVYITAGNNNSLSGPFSGYTISAWVKTPTSFNNNYNAVFTKKYSFYFGFHQDNSFINYGSSGTAYGTEYKSTYTFSLDTWYHLTATADGTNIKMYVNGVLNDTFSDTNTAQNSNTSNTPYLGGFDNSGDYDAYKGKLDAICVFDYALSQDQVTTLYGTGSAIGNPMALPSPPIAYYPLGTSAYNGEYLAENNAIGDYVFDFDADYIDCGNDSSLNLTSEISLSAWVKTTDQDSTNNIIKKDDGTGNRSWNLSWRGSSSGGSRLVFWNWSSDGSYNYIYTTGTPGSNFADGNWHHVVVTYNGTTDTNGAKIYLDGVLMSQGAVSRTGTGLDTTTANVTIGNDLTASISNVQIFNTALPATGSNSVETLYNNGSPLTSMTGFSSLVGWWKLDASATFDSSTNTWTIPDDSTNSNDGTSSGMTQANLVQSDLSFTSGYSPFALDFDAASSDYIDCGDNDNLSFGNGTTDSPFSFSAWINMDDATRFYLLSKGSVFSSNYEYLFNTNASDILGLYLYDSSQNSRIGRIYNTALTTFEGQWIHLVGTYDGSSFASGIKLYLNGTQVDNLNSNSGTYVAMENGNRKLNIGRSETGTYANGKISNVSVWNTALTSAQVSEIYSEGVPSNLNNHSAYSNLVSWWQLGSNSSFNSSLNQWTCIDEKGTNTGESSQTFNEDAIVDGVGSYANGLGTSGLEVVGSAFASSANALSVNMDVEDRVTDTPS